MCFAVLASGMGHSLLLFPTRPLSFFSFFFLPLSLSYCLPLVLVLVLVPFCRACARFARVCFVPPLPLRLPVDVSLPFRVCVFVWGLCLFLLRRLLVLRIVSAVGVR